MKRFGILTAFSAVLALGGAVATFAPQTVSADEACGGKGQKLCPLQEWMENNVQGPMDKKDFKKLEQAFTKLAKMSPDPKWNEGDKGWGKISEQAAAAAKAGDFKAVRGTCKSCHKAWRKQYRKAHRLKPVK